MSILDQQVRRSHVRLTLNVIMRHLAGAVLVAAGAWAFVTLVERAFVLGIPVYVGGGLAVSAALIITLIGVSRGRVDRLRAAVVLDEAAGLKERISTALTCRQSVEPFAQAAVHDAEQTAGRVHVPTHVRYHAPSLWPWSVSALIAAVIFFWFMPELNLLTGGEAEAADDQAGMVERDTVEAALRAEVENVKQRLQDKPALAGLLDGLEELELPDEPSQTPEDVRREAVKRIERVSDKLKQRLEADAMNALDQLKRELAKLETPEGEDGASKLSQALASGDMQAAKKALGDLKKQLAEAAESADPAAKQRLAEMQKKLDDLSKQLAKLGDQQKLLKDLENKGGLSEEQAKKILEQLKGMDPQQMAEQLKKQLADSGMSQKQIEQLAKKIAQNQKMRQQLQDMAQAMAQAAQACQQCQSGADGTNAADAMQGAMQAAMGQLSDLEAAEQMMNELEAQLAELGDLKEDIGEGNCPGLGEGDPNRIGNQGPNRGYGYGARIGKQRGAHQYKATKAPARTQGGKIIGQVLIDGPQVKGDASAEVTDAVASAVRDAADAVEREEVPRQYQRVVQYYFERLAGLMRGESDADKAAKAPEPESSEPAAPEGD
jgi:hypothetical protein